MSVNPPFGLKSYSIDGGVGLLDDDKQKTRPFFVPPGYMRVSLEEGRVLCCPPGLYDLEPHEMFQSVAMKFCPPNLTFDYDAVIDLPLGDFTQSVLLRRPTSDIFDLHLIVQARIAKMKKFALANSSNPGAVVYMILRNEIVRHLESGRAPSQIASQPVLDAVNQKTAEIGLTIRSIFVDNVVRDRRLSPGSRRPPRARASTATAEPGGSDSMTASPKQEDSNVLEEAAEAVIGDADEGDEGDEGDEDDDSQYMVIPQPATMQK